MRHVGLFLDDSSDDFLQETKRTIEDYLIDYLMIFGSKGYRCNCTHTATPDGQTGHFYKLVGSSKDKLSIRRFIQAVSKIALIAITAADEIERDNGDIELNYQGENTHDLYLATSVSM